jgi:hypothetical protein
MVAEVTGHTRENAVRRRRERKGLCAGTAALALKNHTFKNLIEFYRKMLHCYF